MNTRIVLFMNPEDCIDIIKKIMRKNKAII